MYTAGIFMDLSKAFDNINHDILLTNYIFMVLDVFHIHDLQIRKHMTSYKSTLSSSEFIEFGVPQGYIFCPLLFIIMSE